MNDKPFPHDDDPDGVRRKERAESESSDFITTYTYSGYPVIILKPYDGRDPARDTENHSNHHSRPVEVEVEGSDFVTTYCYSAENVFISMKYDDRDPRNPKNAGEE